MGQNLVLDKRERDALEQRGEIAVDSNGDEVLVGLSRTESVEFVLLKNESFIHSLSTAKRRKYGRLKDKRKAALEIAQTA